MKSCDGERLDLPPQPPDRQPVDALQKPPVAPLLLLRPGRNVPRST